MVAVEPGNKTIYVVFDEESECSGPRRPKLSPDQVFQEKRPQTKLRKIINFLINFLINPFLGTRPGEMDRRRSLHRRAGLDSISTSAACPRGLGSLISLRRARSSLAIEPTGLSEQAPTAKTEDKYGKIRFSYIFPIFF